MLHCVLCVLKIAQYVGEEIIKSTAEFAREVTGFAIGGIPPVGHKQNIPTYIDEDLMNYQEIWAAAGTTCCFQLEFFKACRAHFRGNNFYQIDMLCDKFLGTLRERK